MNLTSIHEDVGSIPGLAQQNELRYRLKMWLGSGIAVALIRPLAWEPPYATGATLKRKKKRGTLRLGCKWLIGGGSRKHGMGEKSLM